MKICINHRKPIFDSPEPTVNPYEWGRQGLRMRPGVLRGYNSSQMGSSCCQVSSSMGSSQRDELAQELAQMQPGEVADLMVETYKASRNRGILIGVGVGVVGCIVARKIFY